MKKSDKEILSEDFAVKIMELERFLRYEKREQLQVIKYVSQGLQ